MTKPPFTPGPWVAEMRDSIGFAAPVICNQADTHIAWITRGLPGEGWPDARLIAAAPDLYEALDWLLASVTADPASEAYPGDKEERLILACGAARTALAKANGQ